MQYDTGCSTKKYDIKNLTNFKIYLSFPKYPINPIADKPVSLRRNSNAGPCIVIKQN